MKHTQGHWQTGNGTENCLETDVFIGNNCIDALNEQDARLIAAAPEMLEALECLYIAIKESPEYVDAMKSFGFHIDVVESLKLAKQVINKAKGL